MSDARLPPIARVFALTGGAIFVLSLFYFAITYLWLYDTPREPVNVPAWQSIAINVALFTLFALHHSLFARVGLKAFVERSAPPQLERSIYVWLSSLLFIVVCAAWRSVPGDVWHVTSPLGANLLILLQVTGMVASVLAARRLDIWELSGIRQVWGRPRVEATSLESHGQYRLVRHPIYSAWLVIVWAAPWMNGTRLVFAAVSSLYLVLAVPFEERDLVRRFGSRYEAYRARVRWRMVPGVY